jgi:hypothetical protein
MGKWKDLKRGTFGADLGLNFENDDDRVAKGAPFGRARGENNDVVQCVFSASTKNHGTDDRRPFHITCQIRRDPRIIPVT